MVEPPEKPLPGDCCGGGCSPCVWDTYYEELELYEQHLAASSACHADQPSSTQEADGAPWQPNQDPPPGQPPGLEETKDHATTSDGLPLEGSFREPSSAAAMDAAEGAGTIPPTERVPDGDAVSDGQRQEKEEGARASLRQGRVGEHVLQRRSWQEILRPPRRAPWKQDTVASVLAAFICAAGALLLAVWWGCVPTHVNLYATVMQQHTMHL